MSDEEESVKVAVRVRPFNKRERNRDATCIIEMNGPTTKIFNPDEPGDEKTFTFDYSYWSHDGCEETSQGYFQSKPGGRYIGQKEVFDDLGTGILKNAWDGYNTSLFAYGQTGSGKSWSVVGYGINKGIVPQFCETIFKEIDEKKQSGEETEFEVIFSMLEIYNEKVCDLLDNDSTKNILRVRQHPNKGFYAAGLSVCPVTSYKDIEHKMAIGTRNRTVASTNMNATSSRAHTIVGVTFKQKKKNAAGEVSEKSSIINLVDLAGSERADSTGATGERLKEGAAINQSLSSLGNCIAALAERSEGKKVRVPFRDSVLTKLLKNALGGNSKTIMIAALSPADINYEETLSTLRYADRAKQIKTKAIINEDPVEKMIRELKEENEKLKAQLQNGETILPASDDDDDDDDVDSKDVEKMKAEWQEEMEMAMKQNDKEMEEMKSTYEEKLNAAKEAAKDSAEEEELLEIACSVTPHLSNLNHDPQLSGMIIHLIDKDVTRIGNKKADTKPDIVLPGLNIKSQHGEIYLLADKSVRIKSINDGKILVNGEPLDEEIQLQHNDRLMFGLSNLYLFIDPAFVKEKKERNEVIETFTYEDAQDEIAKNSGVTVSSSSQGNVLNDTLVDILPAVNEANGMSEELDKKVAFELIVMPSNSQLKLPGFDQVFIKVTHLLSGHVWFWSKQKFMNRKYAMDEMYQSFKEDNALMVASDKDPFVESTDTETIIGICELYVSNIAYMMDIQRKAAIMDYRGMEIGEIEVDLLPTINEGTTSNNEIEIINSPYELEGRSIEFKVVIGKVVKLPKRYTDVYCKYSAFSHKDIRTSVSSEEKKFNFQQEHVFSLENISKKMIDFMLNEPVVIEIWGKQKADRVKPINNAAKMGRATSEIMKLEVMRKSLGGKKSKKSHVSLDLVKREAEYFILQRRLEMMEKKLLAVSELCENKEKDGEQSLMVNEVRDIVKSMKVPLATKKKSKRSSSESSSSSSDSDDKSSKLKDREKNKGGDASEMSIPYKYERKKKRRKKKKELSAIDENANERRTNDLKAPHDPPILEQKRQSQSSAYCVII